MFAQAGKLAHLQPMTRSCVVALDAGRNAHGLDALAERGRSTHHGFGELTGSGKAKTLFR